MLVFFQAFLCIFAKSFPGQWEKISVDNDVIVAIMPHLKEVVPQLFSEIGQYSFQITSAQQQIVSGNNFRLSISCPEVHLSFDIEFNVDPQQKLHVINVRRSIGLRPQLGEYRWEYPASFSTKKLRKLIETIQKQVDLLVGKAGTVLVYRTKRNQGLWTHVIFSDSNNNVFSVVTQKKPTADFEDVVSIYQIF